VPRRWAGSSEIGRAAQSNFQLSRQKEREAAESVLEVHGERPETGGDRGRRLRDALPPLDALHSPLSDDVFRIRQHDGGRETHISAAVSFFGLPSLAGRNTTKAKKLRMTNDHRTSYKLNKVECSTASELTRTFRPWNDMLYSLLADRSQAPPMEPPFPRFTVRVPCTNVKQKLPSPLAESTNETGSSDAARPWRVELLL